MHWRGLTYRNRLIILILVSYSKPGRRRIVKRTLEPIAVNSLFRWINSLFGRKNSGFRIEQGNLPQRIGIAERIDRSLDEKGSKMAGIRKIPCYFPCWQGIGTCSNSAESGLLEVIIGLDDLAQLVFRGAIPAIGVGVMAFHQLLEPRLDVGAGGVRRPGTAAVAGLH